ncbi:MAG: type I methionyl aminopeptidase, partial [Cytophagaceae bacterium]
IQVMHEASQHTAEILEMMCQAVAPGISTWDLDGIARAEIKRRGLKSPFLGYHGYPAVICASVNEEIVHGIPRRDKILAEGDIISLDFGVICKGYVGDTARTVAVGEISRASQLLIDTTRDSLDRAIAYCTPEYRLSDLGRVVQTCVESAGYSIVRDFVGHGIGTAMHEDPQVPNYYDGPKPRLRPGLVIAIEPMVNMGTFNVDLMEDGWTALTRDRKRSAHFEHTIAITDGDPWVLSKL